MCFRAMALSITGLKRGCGATGFPTRGLGKWLTILSAYKFLTYKGRGPQRHQLAAVRIVRSHFAALLKRHETVQQQWLSRAFSAVKGLFSQSVMGRAQSVADKPLLPSATTPGRWTQQFVPKLLQTEPGHNPRKWAMNHKKGSRQAPFRSTYYAMTYSINCYFINW